ncbi:MAG: efflux RND transporter periplasmic adaptor subunit [Geminicoccaceae bacterium]
MRLTPKLLLPIILIAISLAGAGFLRATKPKVEPAAEVEQVWSVRATMVDHRDHRPVLNLYGELIAGRDVVLRPDVAGKVVEASPKLLDGGRFDEDELILRIDPFDYQASIDELSAEHRKAEARRAELLANRAMEENSLELDREQLKLVARDVERYERLSGSRAASEKSYDDARIAFSRQTGTVQQRQHSIEMLDAKLDQQAAIIAKLEVAARQAERELAETEIRAPFSGFVTEVGAQLGKQLNSNDTIARLIDDQRLDISFQLPEADFGRLWQQGLIGREVIGRWRLGSTVFEMKARVDRVVSTIDSASGGVTVYAGITDNPSNAPLRPGAFVEVEMLDRLYEDVVELPASALFDGDTVYIINDDRLQPETVELVAMSGNNVLVQADLEDGVPVVTSRLAEIAPGLKVKVAR